MRFLEEIQFSDNEFGIQLVVRLADGWQDAARKVPHDKVEQVLSRGVSFANNRLRELNQQVELSFGEYGLHHIHITPDRIGLDLYPDQNHYISHNFTKSNHVAAVMPIIFDYLMFLEHLNGKQV